MKEIVYGEFYESGRLVFDEKDHNDWKNNVEKTIWEQDGTGITWAEFKKKYPEAYDELHLVFMDSPEWTFEDWFSTHCDTPEWRAKPESQCRHEAMEKYKLKVEIPWRLPFPDEPFQIVGALDEQLSEWMPRMLRQSDCIPPEIEKEFGEHDTFTEETYFKSEDETSIVAALEKLGYQCTRTDVESQVCDKSDRVSTKPDTINIQRGNAGMALLKKRLKEMGAVEIPHPGTTTVRAYASPWTKPIKKRVPVESQPKQKVSESTKQPDLEGKSTTRMANKGLARAKKRLLAMGAKEVPHPGGTTIRAYASPRTKPIRKQPDSTSEEK